MTSESAEEALVPLHPNAHLFKTSFVDNVCGKWRSLLREVINGYTHLTDGERERNRKHHERSCCICPDTRLWTF